MNEAERQQAFLNEYNALTQRYGLTFDAVATWEVLGPILQMRGQLTIKAIEGWKPLEYAEEPFIEKADPDAESRLRDMFAAQNARDQTELSKQKNGRRKNVKNFR